MPTNLFFTADTHFFHRRLAEMRGFADISAMNEALVEEWNAVVAKNDRVYHLGDVALGNPTAMTNEVLCKVIGRNLTCLIQEQESLGIVPVFWKDEEECRQVMGAVAS
jgi:calcineurin-like phosphoesterase family protein